MITLIVSLSIFCDRKSPRLDYCLVTTCVGPLFVVTDILPLSCIDIIHTNKFTKTNKQQWQSGTIVVKHLKPVLSRLLGEQQTHQETEKTDES